MLLKRMIGCALGLGLGFAAANASAGEPGWYMGLSAGQSAADLDQEEYDDIVLSAFESVGTVLDGESSLDDSDTTWSIFGGYRLNSYISFEAAYLDLGEPGYHAEGVIDPFGPVAPFAMEANIDFASTGFTTAFIGSLPLGEMFELHARAGIFFSDTEITLSAGDGDISDSQKFSGTDTDIFYGAGLAVHFGSNWSVTVDYQLFQDVGSEDDTGETDVDSATVGLIFRFY